MVRRRAVTGLHHTIDGITIQCMVGQCRHPLSLPEVFFEARSKVMEMVEHSPRQGKPTKLPIVRCERPLSRLDAWLEYGVNVEHMGRLVVKPGPLCE